jgi:hypothetical protein
MPKYPIFAYFTMNSIYVNMYVNMWCMKYTIKKKISFSSVFACNVDLYILHGSASDGRSILQKPYATMN